MLLIVGEILPIFMKKAGRVDESIRVWAKVKDLKAKREKEEAAMLNEKVKL